MKEFFLLVTEYPYYIYSLILIILSSLCSLIFRRQITASMACLILSIASYFSGSSNFGNTFLAIWIFLLFCATISSRIESKIALSIFGALGVFLLGTLGILHMIPYYVNWQIYSGLYLGSSLQPYTIYYNLDKGVLGGLLFLLIVRNQSIGEEWKKRLKVSLWFALITIVLFMLILYPFGFVKWDPKIPSISLVWLLCNAFLVCLPEEVFFRGFVFGFFTQKSFDYLNDKERFLIGYFLSSALYALYHYRLGWTYMILAFVAGLIYGWVYHKTKNVEYSTLSHLLVNATHFFLFSYPILKW